MRLVTFNVNGLRTFANPDLATHLNVLEGDIICLQETKATKETLESRLALVSGYTSYFNFSTSKTGYSGVATFCRPEWTPINTWNGLGVNKTDWDDEYDEDEMRTLDSEGRAIITEHPLKDCSSRLFIINVYCPRADASNVERQAFKLRFYSLLQRRAWRIILDGHHVVVCGDINTSHRRIDHCDPDEDSFDLNPSRKWLDQLLRESSTLDKSKEDANLNQVHSGHVMNEDQNVEANDDGLLFDAFRLFHPLRENAFTCWNTKLNCRASNYGTRIDYILPSISLSNMTKACDIRPEVQGSDHCPVQADFDVEPEEGKRDPPSGCTIHWPQFGGKHRKLSAFFQPKATTTRIQSIKPLSKTTEVESRVTQSTKSICQSQRGYKRTSKTTARAKQRKLAEFFGNDRQCITKERDRVEDESDVGPQSNKDLVNFESVKDENYSSFTASQPCISSSQSSSPSVQSWSSSNSSSVVNHWRSLLHGKRPSAPPCSGHSEPCVLRTVKKKGANVGRQFWTCARGEGKIGDADAKCNFFQWLKS